MLIQSLLERVGGTVIPMGNSTYVFKPTEKDPRHIAEVSNPDHAERFLSIKEGYAKVKGGNTSPQADLLTGADSLVAASGLTGAANAGDAAPSTPAAEENPYVDPAIPATPQAPVEAAQPETADGSKATPVAEFDAAAEKAALIEQAKALKIKSPHLYSTEKLKAMIAGAYSE